LIVQGLGDLPRPADGQPSDQEVGIVQRHDHVAVRPIRRPRAQRTPKHGFERGYSSFGEGHGTVILQLMAVPHYHTEVWLVAEVYDGSQWQCRCFAW
jgi:hypothetical protein